MAQKIKFVTDSASDIPRSLREELDILVLPFPIAIKWSSRCSTTSMNLASGF